MVVEESSMALLLLADCVFLMALAEAGGYVLFVVFVVLFVVCVFLLDFALLNCSVFSMVFAFFGICFVLLVFVFWKVCVVFVKLLSGLARYSK